MENLDLPRIFREEKIAIEPTDRKSLFIILGLLGDFDSFEYVQNIVRFLPKLIESDINLSIIAIGDSNSKDKFCEYTKLPPPQFDNC